MSTRRRPGRQQENPSPRSRTSVLSIAFAIAMAFFLVIGMVAVALPEFIDTGSTDPDTEPPAEPPTMQEQGEGEEQELRDRLEENPDDVDARSQLAVLLSNSGRVEEAIPHYEEALEERPDDVSLRLSFARALNRQGYTLDAEIQLEQALEDDPENVEAMFLMAEVKEQDQGAESDEANELYEQIVETDPDSYYAEMARERLGEASEDAPEEGDAGSSDEDQS